jgi:hypothetical protein
LTSIAREKKFYCLARVCNSQVVREGKLRDKSLKYYAILVLKIELAVIDKINQGGRVFKVEFFQDVIPVNLNRFYGNV